VRAAASEKRRYEDGPVSYARHQFAPDIIWSAEVKDLRAERGLEVPYEMVRRRVMFEYRRHRLVGRSLPMGLRARAAGGLDLFGYV
jgi:hypothetical protein